MTDETVVEQTEEETNDQEATESTEQPSVEALASKLGWAPEEDWRGEDGQEWRDASTFLEEMIDGRQALKKTLQRQDGELAQVRETLNDFKKHYETVNERAYKRAKAELEQQFSAAVEKGDTAGAMRVRGEIEELEQPKPNGQANPDEDPHFKAFHAENQWYGDNVKMTAYAEQVAPIVARKGYTGAAFYEEVAREVNAEFAEKKPKRGQAVEGASGLGARRKGGKTYDDLPSDAKAACDNFVAEKVLTREQYVKDYFAGEG